VSNALWDKPGPLGRGEMEQVRTHAFHTDRIVAAIGGAIGDVAGLASAAHERLDASGYHRGLAAAGLSKWTRLVAAADVAQALSEARPHRPAFSQDDANRTLRELARRGALCPRAVDAVLGSPDDKPSRARASFPAGLSGREVEVLRLVARGMTDKEVASRLGISHRTVHHHNKHAYDKIGVSTRAAAALFLVENDLLGA
jgi:HD-GYP domain-containing protein (c-di-GMP phosphodiesterase class II)